MRIPRIAAIDIGTNSFHIVVASVNKDSMLRIHGRDKEMVRLGEGANDMKRLSEAAMDRGVKCLVRFIEGAKKEKARVRAIATSAVREALNKDEFVERVEKATGVRMEVVSGEEEGRLVYIGVIHALPIVDYKVLVCDIGGGSTETTIGKSGEVEYVHSEKLGTIRLTQKFWKSGNVNDEKIAECREFIKGDWAPTFDALRNNGFDIFVGTSGTFQTLARIVLTRRNAKIPEVLNGVICSREELFNVINDIVDARVPQKIALIPGMESKRADIILAGALLVEQILIGVGAHEVMISGYALREGIVFDSVQQLADMEEYHHLSMLRADSVFSVCKICNIDMKHAEHVKNLCLQLFDSLESLHGLGDFEREILEAAALLHDVGYMISTDQHHKHSYYIIKNAVLPGFTNDEAEMIAQVARYHRKSHPKKKHDSFARLPLEKQRQVKILASLLRIAEGADRRRNQLVQEIKATISSMEIKLVLLPKRAEAVPDIEQWGADRRKDLAEILFERNIEVVVEK